MSRHPETLNHPNQSPDRLAQVLDFNQKAAANNRESPKPGQLQLQGQYPELFSRGKDGQKVQGGTIKRKEFTKGSRGNTFAYESGKSALDAQRDRREAALRNAKKLEEARALSAETNKIDQEALEDQSEIAGNSASIPGSEPEAQVVSNLDKEFAGKQQVATAEHGRVNSETRYSLESSTVSV